MELTCDRCGRTFTAARADARYCSGKCRTDAYRVRKDPNRPPVKRETDEDLNIAAADHLHNYLGALVQTHSALRPGTVQYMVRRLRDTADAMDHPEADVNERDGATAWSRTVQNVSANVPMDDLTEDEVLELGGAAEWLHNYTKGAIVLRRAASSKGSRAVTRK